MKKKKQLIQPQKEKWYQSRNIQATIIIAIINVAGWFINPYINRQITLLQKNDSTTTMTKTTVNQAEEIITYGPNSTVNISIATRRECE